MEKNKNEDYKIAEYEERLKKIAELREKINNPEPERLLSEHKKLEHELQILTDDKTRLYGEIKKIIEEGHQLIQTARGLVCFFKGNYSQAGHPELHYFFEGSLFPTGGIATFAGIHFKDLTPGEFMSKLMKSEGFMPRSL